MAGKNRMPIGEYLAIIGEVSKVFKAMHLVAFIFYGYYLKRKLIFINVLKNKK